MDAPFILAVCVPGNFLNPFPPLLQQAVICGGLLSLQVLLLFPAARYFSQIKLSRWQQAMYPAVQNSTLGAAVGVWSLAGWLWWQEQHFTNTCFLGPADLRLILFTATQRAVDVTIVLTILLLLAGFLLGAMLLKHQQPIQPAH